MDSKEDTGHDRRKKQRVNTMLNLFQFQLHLFRSRIKAGGGGSRWGFSTRTSDKGTR